MRISDWSSDVCSSDLGRVRGGHQPRQLRDGDEGRAGRDHRAGGDFRADGAGDRAGRVVRTDPGRLRARTRARGVRASAAAARKGAGSRRMSTKKTIRPYTRPAGGWDALRNAAKHLIEQDVPVHGAKTLLSPNQPDGFDCPGCAWPDRDHTSTFEFCENGAKAVAAENGRAHV